MNLIEKIENELKIALKEKDKIKLSTLRLLKAEIKNAEIEKKDDLNDEDIMQIISREVKRRREAISEYNRGNRPELAEKESKEAEVLSEYLPEQLSEEEIHQIIIKAIAEVQANSPQDLGKVMSQVMPAIKGRADGKVVNQLAREALSK